MRNRILSLLVLLLTAATGAWATDPTVYFKEVAISSLKMGDILAPGFSLTGTDDDCVYFKANRHKLDNNKQTTDNYFTLLSLDSYEANSAIKFGDGSNSVLCTPVDANGNDGNAWEVTDFQTEQGTTIIYLSGTTIELPIVVNWNAENNTGTFKMPGSDVLLTPIYSAATVYQADGVTEKKAYTSLKEAFAAVQSGDVVKLDWNVTLTQTEALETPSTGNGLKFTLDFNGYTIDASEHTFSSCIYLHNANDEIMFTDGSDTQTGGLKGVANFVTGSKAIFAGGRYFWGAAIAADLNYLCLNTDCYNLAPGMEFVDLEGGDTENDGFIVRATYKPIELTIGPKRFATFYAATNFKLADNTPDGVGIYTITKINDTDGKHTSATATQLGSVIASCTPMLVYNGSDAQQTVTLQATTDAATVTTVKPIDAFKGTFVDRAFTDADMAAADYYALSGGKAFAQVKGSGTLGANKCWLQFDKQQTGNAPASLMIVFEDGDLTEVKEAIGVNEVNDDTIYDLSGRKVGSSFNVQRSTLKKGVYIQNGQKVVK